MSLAIPILVLVSCGGGSSSSQSVTYPVTLSWTANDERGVNSAGGGYKVEMSRHPVVFVPYESGPFAPTSTTVYLPSGNCTVTVRAYAALDAQGGMTGRTSAPSASVTVHVP